MKKCHHCQVSKPPTSFNRNRHSEDGRQSYCRTCTTAQSRSYYSRHRERMVRQIRNASDRRVEIACKKVIEYLRTHPCIGCNEKNPVVLDFDHVRGEKCGDVSAMVTKGYSWQVIEREIKKCVVRCANCHRIKTAKEGNYLRWKLCQEQALEAVVAQPPTLNRVFEGSSPSERTMGSKC